MGSPRAADSGNGRRFPVLHPYVHTDGLHGRLPVGRAPRRRGGMLRLPVRRPSPPSSSFLPLPPPPRKETAGAWLPPSCPPPGKRADPLRPRAGGLPAVSGFLHASSCFFMFLHGDAPGRRIRSASPCAGGGTRRREPEVRKARFGLPLRHAAERGAGAGIFLDGMAMREEGGEDGMCGASRAAACPGFRPLAGVPDPKVSRWLPMPRMAADASRPLPAFCSAFRCFLPFPAASRGTLYIPVHPGALAMPGVRAHHAAG